MNYASYSSTDDLWDAVSSGVNEEWLKPDTRFQTDVRNNLDLLHYMARRSTDGKNYCPSPINVLNMFKLIKPKDVKVVILAQDPYPRLIDALGIAFHTTNSTVPASVKSMVKNLKHHGHVPTAMSETADLTPWIERGVALFNVSLTTLEGKSNEHATIWDQCINLCFNSIPKDSVALLLGNPARSTGYHLPCKKKVEHVHPATRVAGQFNEKDCFGDVNKCLAELKLSTIDWTL